MLARPMFFEFPTDNGTHAFTRQFMFGPHLLVVPGTKLRASSKLVKAYFPRGVWYEPRKGHRIQSLGQTIFVPESKHSVAPFFARAGSIVPREIAGAIQLQVFLDDGEQAAGDLFQLPTKGPELEALVANNYSLFHFFYVKGALTWSLQPVRGQDAVVLHHFVRPQATAISRGDQRTPASISTPPTGGPLLSRAVFLGNVLHIVGSHHDLVSDHHSADDRAAPFIQGAGHCV
ncbi:hypothetical protein MRX96_059819 [Rhipicephalus microplus]